MSAAIRVAVGALILVGVWASAAQAAPVPTAVTPPAATNTTTSVTLTVSGTAMSTVTGIYLAKAGEANIVGTSVTANALQAQGTFNLIDQAPGAWTPHVLDTTPSDVACTCTFTIAALAPTVSSVTPNTGGQGATNRAITITGTNIFHGATVSFSGTGITVNGTPTWVNNTTLTASINIDPAATTGARSLIVTNSDGQAGTCVNCFTVNPAPTVSTATPASRGVGASHQTIGVVGTGFASPLTATISGTLVTVHSATFVDATHANLDVSIDVAATAGARNISIVNPDGGTGACTGCFTLNPRPTVSSTTPTSRGQGAQTQSVTITGTNFTNTFGVPTATFGTGVTVTNVAFTNATTLVATISIAPGAPTGLHDVTVTNADGGAASLACSCFTVNAGPTPASASPSSRGRGATAQLVTITASSATFVATEVVSFGADITVTNVSHTDSTHIVATINIASIAALGARDFTVTNPDAGVGTCVGCFTVTAAPVPTIAAPASRGAGAQNQTLVVTGTNFDATPTLSFNTNALVTVNTLTRDSSTQLTANISIAAGATTGDAGLKVTNSDGGAQTCACFTINAAPTATLSNPATAANTAATLITVTGTNFDSSAGSMLLRKTGTGAGTIADIACTGYNRASATSASATCSLSNVAPGAWSIMITNADAGGPATLAFTITAGAPSGLGISPASRGQGATAQTLTITGTNLFPGATASFALVGPGTNGIVVSSTTVTAPSQIVVVANVDIAATTGARNLTVTNTDGLSSTCTGCFTVNAKPTATSVSPAFASNAGTVSLTVTGTGFDNSSGSAQLTRSGQTAITGTSYSRIDATHVSASFNLTGAAPGLWTMSVTNGDQGGPATCADCVTVAGSNPLVSSCSPTSIGQGAQNKDVTITGSNFANGAQATVSGTGITVVSTTYSSPTQVIARLNIDPTATLGARNLTVTNTDTQAGTGTACFSIAAGPTATSANPSSRGQGASSHIIVVAGTNFVATPTVSVGSGITVDSVARDSSTQLSVGITVGSGATPGARDISVVNPDSGTATCSSCFTVTAAPTVTSATPSSRGQGATNQNIVLAGTGFITTPTVSFSGSGITVNTVTRDSATQLTVNINVSGAAATTVRTISVSNPDGGTNTCVGCFTVNAAPTLTSTNPSSRGQGASNQNIVMTGTGFAGTPTIAFSGAGITVNTVTRDSATQLTVNIAISSLAATGARDVTVTNADTGTATCLSCFTVNAAPTLASATPSSRGQGAASQTVVLAGSGFAGTPGVSFSGTGITVNTVTRDSATQITLNVSVGGGAAVGARDVTVTNPDAGAALCTGCFTINAAPAPVSATPSSRGQGATNQAIVIAGSNFASTPSVSFSGAGVTVNSTTFDTPSQLTINVSVAAGAATTLRTITVTNPDGGTATCTNCFTVNAGPSVSTVSPNALGQGATSRNVVVTGSAFDLGISSAFSSSGITISSTTRDSATQVTINLSIDGAAPPGARDLTLTNTDGGVTTCPGCFTVNAAPTVTSATPSSRAQGTSGQSIVLTGTNFLATPTVSFSGSNITVNTVVRDSATQLTVSIDVGASAATGARDITVTNPDFSTPAVCVACFTINATPTVSNATPSSRGQGASNQDIVIAGTGFSATPTVGFSGGGITVNSVTHNSPTQITANISIGSAAATGARTITVTNPDAGSAICSGCFTVNNGPNPTSSSPASRGAGSTSQDIAILGTDFVATPTVTFSGSGISVNTVTHDSATQVTVNIDISGSATPGARDVTITNPDAGSRTCTGCFTVVAPPLVTSASPSGLVQGATNQTVTLAGSGFTASTGVSISGTGVTVNSVTFDSPTQLTLDVSVTGGAPSGARDITTTNADAGRATCVSCFNVGAAPTITSATPSTRAQGSTNQNIVLAGTNFISTPTVSFSGSGITVNSVTRDSATQLTVNVDIDGAAPTGLRDITATNPDTGVGTCTSCFTVSVAPTVTSATPSSRGQGATNQNVVLAGTNFVATPSVAFSGSGITVNSVTQDNAAQLTVNITVGSGAATGLRSITVTNSDAGAATCVGCFTVNVAPTATGVSPSSSQPGGPVSLTIDGTNFDDSTGSALLRRTGQSDIAGTSYTRLSATQVSASFDLTGAAPGLWSVRVTNGDAGGPGVCTDCFTVETTAPLVSSASPNNLGQGATTQTVTITGANFVSTPTVTFSGSGITVNSTTFTDATHIDVNVTVSTGAATTARTISVTNPDLQSGSCVSCFTVNVGPSLTSITPNTRHKGATAQNLVLAGANFAGTPTVTFSGAGITVNTVTVDNASQLTVNVSIGSGAATGARDVIVVNPDAGRKTLVSGFTVTGPASVALTAPTSLTGGVLANFSEDVSNVTSGNFVLRLTGTATDLAGTLTCANQGGSATPCSSSTVRRATLTPTMSLTSGQHYTASVDPAGAGSFVLDGDGSPLAATNLAFRASRAEQESSVGATYVWRTVSASSALGGSYTTERDAGARSTYTFTGTSVIWYTITGSDQGLASVSLDGVAKGIVNNYAAGRHFNVTRTYAASGNGPHTLQIYVKGQKGNANATAPYVTIDAFRPGTGTVLTTPPVLYRWRSAPVGSATVATTDAPSARVTFTFRGTGIDWYTVFGINQGKATVYIDGAFVRSVDNYRTSTFVARHLFRGLSDSVHTIRIFVSANKNAASTGTAVGVDAFVVI